MSIEIVERKGIGHPDTIADAIANELSRRFTTYTQENLGGTPRHSFDKLVLHGGTSILEFGGGKAITPITCDVVGKLADRFADRSLPVEELLVESIRAVFARTFSKRALELLPAPLLRFSTNSGIGAEHKTDYYAPVSSEQLDTIDLDCDANDTAVVFGHDRHTELEYLVWRLENYLTSQELQIRHGTGTDVKVLARRWGMAVDLQVAVPFVAGLVGSEQAYRESLEVVTGELGELAQQVAPGLHVSSLRANTKDRPGFGYLTLAGSSLDKGDQGAVGRGNNYSGVISMLRPQSMESHAGKNPFRSAGRIYPEVCRRLSRQMAERYGVDMSVGIQSANGRPLREPVAIFAVPQRGGNSGDFAEAAREARELAEEVTQDTIVEARRILLGDDQARFDIFGRVAEDVSH
jgi:S-adenosylmethionine synthetase